MRELVNDRTVDKSLAATEHTSSRNLNSDNLNPSVTHFITANQNLATVNELDFDNDNEIRNYFYCKPNPT